MLGIMLLFILAAVGLVVMAFFLPFKKAPQAAKKAAVTEIANETIDKLEGELNVLKMELEKEQLKTSALQGEVNSAKESENAMRQELEKLQSKTPDTKDKEKIVSLNKELEEKNKQIQSLNSQIQDYKKKIEEISKATVKKEEPTPPKAAEPKPEKPQQPQAAPKEKPKQEPPESKEGGTGESGKTKE